MPAVVGLACRLLFLAQVLVDANVCYDTEDDKQEATYGVPVLVAQV